MNQSSGTLFGILTQKATRRDSFHNVGELPANQCFCRALQYSGQALPVGGAESILAKVRRLRNFISGTLQ